MKLLMLIGAVMGFGLGLFFSYSKECSWPSVLWRASASAYVAAHLLRWWGRRWEKNLRLALLERQAMESAAAAQPPATKR